MKGVGFAGGEGGGGEAGLAEDFDLGPGMGGVVLFALDDVAVGAVDAVPGEFDGAAEFAHFGAEVAGAATRPTGVGALRRGKPVVWRAARSPGVTASQLAARAVTAASQAASLSLRAWMAAFQAVSAAATALLAATRSSWAVWNWASVGCRVATG